MGLDRRDIQTADKENVTWDIGSYNLSTRRCCFYEAFDDWVTLIMATPATMSNNPGWSNLSDGEYDRRNWNYKSQGTRTTILPSKEEQNKILKAIEHYKKGQS
jgi:hypothetical protein